MFYSECRTKGWSDIGRSAVLVVAIGLDASAEDDDWYVSVIVVRRAVSSSQFTFIQKVEGVGNQPHVTRPLRIEAILYAL